MDLNIPDTRQRLLAQRLDAGCQIVATDVAKEFDVSLDTIRRDILALEANGLAQRVRGGAMPIARPADPLHARINAADAVNPAIIRAAIREIGDAPTLLMDGGATTLSLIPQLAGVANRLVITPSPWVAIACQEHAIAVFLIGGTLSARGGIAVGDHAQLQTGVVSANIAILGACGVDTSFGLSSDDHAESQMKQAMHAAAARTIVVTGAQKIGRRARHHTLPLDQIDAVITDADHRLTAPFSDAGTTFIHA
ncbi:DeoR/GlpR family DNA-binding transcription regulator [Yoonia sp. I 8.24]|uniref:DeoR/GlpR family DNA-binding transcription regulator n=1 Tax=Yoonia sp. I 8.24 TaxID=1537229 RepID=UPI001EDDB398|nr:DeoR/GlpR family DNA-binding transcription regulator [Yoonia sp. I 8.24]MCG3268151.1 DeoR/GlpR transcriptional regulator [Yoonia sp. I 8.24]